MGPSDRRWLYYIIGAIGVAAIAAAIAWSAIAPFESETAEQKITQECGYAEALRRENAASDDYAKAQQFTGPPALIEEYRRSKEIANQAVRGAEECEKRSRERSNLAAQWASAHVSRELRAFTIFETLLLVLTIGVGVAALIQNARALKSQESGLATEVYENRLAGERQVRAYVTVVAVRHSWEEEGKRITFEIDLMNGGQTPATHVTFQILLAGDLGPAPLDAARVASRPIMGGQTETVVQDIQGDDIHRLTRRTTQEAAVDVCFMWVNVQYKDVFGNEFESTVRFFVHEPPTEGSWVEWVMYFSDTDPLFKPVSRLASQQS